MKALYLFFAGIVLATALLFLNQMWFTPLNTVVFWKLLISIGIIGGVALVMYLIYREMVADKKLKDDKFVD